MDLDLFKMLQTREIADEKVRLDRLDIGAILSPGSCEV